MKHCVNCGHQVSDEKFCGNCGIALECVSCGQEFKAQEAFCTNCGTARPNSQPVQTQVNNLGQNDQAANISQTQVNQPVQSNYQYSNQPETGYTPPQNNSNVIKIVVALAAVAAIIFAYFNFFAGPSTPKEVVEAFFEAVEERDYDKLKKLVDPAIHDEINFAFMPRDAKFEILGFDEITIEGNEAFVDVTVFLSSKSENVAESEYFYVYLEKRDGKWIIYDMY